MKFHKICWVAVMKERGDGDWRGKGKVTFTKLLFEIKKSLNLIYPIKFYKLKNFKQVNVEIYLWE